MEQFLLLASVNMVAVASPGPDFALVLKNTLSSGRKVGIATAFGIGMGILVHLSYTLLGIGFILSKSEGLYTAIKWAGAAYLLYLALVSFKSQKSPAEDVEPIETQAIKNPSSKEIRRGLRQGFIVNVLNPKATLFFVAIFTSVVSPNTPMTSLLLYAAWIFVYVIVWFSMVAWAFSGHRITHWYQQQGYLIDRLMGVFLLLLAVRMLF